MTLGLAGEQALVIGVAGGTGSGKSTVAAAMADAAPGKVLIERPLYDFEASDRLPETLRLGPAPVVVVEGILVLHEPELRRRMDLKVFIDAPPDERFIRRLERDVNERGRSAQSVIDQYRSTVKSMHDLHVEPTKLHADLIVPEGGKNRVAVRVLVDHVRASIGERA